MNDKTNQKMRTEILEEIQAFMRRHDAQTAAWHVGTAVSAMHEMFEVHGFKKGDVGLYRKARSADDASSVAAYLIRRGASGDASAKSNAAYVFAFKKTAHAPGH